MYKEIPVGDKTIGFMSNAATPIRYKALFKKDLLRILSESSDPMAQTETAQELAFIMAMQAKRVDMKTLNLDKYVEWLEQFEAFDIMEALGEITEVYTGSEENAGSSPKK